MAIVFRIGSLTFFFYSNEGNPREPVHIHVRQGKSTAKFWLKPFVSLAHSHRFDPRTLLLIADMIHANKGQIERGWHEHFS